MTNILEPMKDLFLTNTLDDASSTTISQEGATTPRRSSSRRCMSTTGATCLTRPDSRTATSRRTGRASGRSGATRCSPAYRRRPASGSSASVSRWASTRATASLVLTFLDAYNVKLVDDEGKLLVDDPKIHGRLGRGAERLHRTLVKGCTPPSATSWKDPDNNVAFHNKTTVMTHNATISIAAKWLDDMNNATLTAEQRAQAKKNYEELIRTAGFPNKPDGTPMKLSRRGQDRRHLHGREEQEGGQGVRGVPARGREPHALRRGLARPLVPGHQGGAERPFWTGRTSTARSVYNQFKAGTVTVRVHEELQVHDPEQRERLGQGDEPRRQREVAGREGRRRDDRPHQGDRRLRRQRGDPSERSAR